MGSRVRFSSCLLDLSELLGAMALARFWLIAICAVFAFGEADKHDLQIAGRDGNKAVAKQQASRCKVVLWRLCRS